jgi:cyclophilin family peptidyl-prolyl cis-trans isomerase
MMDWDFTESKTSWYRQRSVGTGSGDAGYKFKDEFTDLRFDAGGVLAMANNGPN